MASFGPFAAVLLLAVLVGAVTAVLAARRYPEPGAAALAGLLSGAGIWAAGILLELLVASDDAAALLHRLSEIGVVVVVAFYLVFALQYTGRGNLVTWRSVLVLAIEPAIVIAFAVSNPMHQLFYAEWTRSSVGMVVTTGGPVFWMHVVYSYLLVVGATAMLLRTASRARTVDQPQFAALAIAIFTPWLLNLLYLFGPFPVDITAAGFAVTGVALYVAMVRYDFMTLTPIARDTLVDVLDDAMVVLDDDRVVDCNPAAAAMFTLDQNAVIGEPVATVFADYPALRDVFRSPGNATILEVDTPNGTRDLKVTGTAVDDREHTDGKLFLLHDITDQQRHQRELERQNEQLDQFASLISHDLRNPLDVAMGRAKVVAEMNEDERLDEHLDEVVDAHDRMRRIIDDVLTLARQGRSISDKEDVDLAVLAEDAWSHVETRDATLSVDTDTVIKADRGRLAQVLENLFRNAVQHGGEAVTVEVGATADGFYVADDGVGIPPAERDRIFEAGETDADGGTGLGLSIVRNIAHAHGWSVDVTSSEAGGARMEFGGVEQGDPDHEGEESVPIWESG
jgi:signal transduction histidine kinase